MDRRSDFIKKCLWQKLQEFEFYAIYTPHNLISFNQSENCRKFCFGRWSIRSPWAQIDLILTWVKNRNLNYFFIFYFWYFMSLFKSFIYTFSPIWKTIVLRENFLWSPKVDTSTLSSIVLGIDPAYTLPQNCWFLTFWDINCVDCLHFDMKYQEKWWKWTFWSKLPYHSMKYNEKKAGNWNFMEFQIPNRLLFGRNMKKLRNFWFFRYFFRSRSRFFDWSR